MRNLYASLLLALPLGLLGQPVNTVQNGPWTDPNTWDCLCVPGAGDSLVIQHSVQITGDLTFTFPHVHVTNVGEITMMFPATILLGGSFIIDGHVLLIGEVTNAGGTIEVTWLFEVIGQFNNDGSLVMDGGWMQVEGDFNNYLSVDGDGSICVYDTTYNDGNFSGTVDLCDATPTTSTAPIIDVNMGSMAGTVTYCTNSVCSFAAVNEGWAGGVTVFPNPSSGPVTVRGLAGMKGSLVLRDVAGRIHQEEVLTGMATEQLLDPPGAGGYTVELRTPAGSKTWKLIFAEAASR